MAIEYINPDEIKDWLCAEIYAASTDIAEKLNTRITNTDNIANLETMINALRNDCARLELELSASRERPAIQIVAALKDIAAAIRETKATP